MCVIIVKKSGTGLPKKAFLKRASEVNPDGFGYATSTGKYYRSMDFEDWYNHLKRDVKKEDDVIMHFRWATHGSNKVANCHPFEGEVNGKKVWFAHNGILDIESVNDKTDSEICFREYLIPIMERHGYNKFTEFAINGVIGSSRFAFVDDSGVSLYGRWIKYEEGLYLSNDRFLPVRFNYPSSSAFGFKGSTYGCSGYVGQCKKV